MPSYASFIFTTIPSMPRCSTSLCETSISNCSPLGIITPRTLSLPRASTHSAATTELSLPPERPMTALQPWPFSSNQSLIHLTISFFDFSALNISITSYLSVFSARYQTGGKFNDMKTLLLVSYQHFHFYASYCSHPDQVVLYSLENCENTAHKQHMISFMTFVFYAKRRLSLRIHLYLWSVEHENNRRHSR